MILPRVDWLKSTSNDHYLEYHHFQVQQVITRSNIWLARKSFFHTQQPTGNRLSELDGQIKVDCHYFRFISDIISYTLQRSSRFNSLQFQKSLLLYLLQVNFFSAFLPTPKDLVLSLLKIQRNMLCLLVEHHLCQHGSHIFYKWQLCCT